MSYSIPLVLFLTSLFPMPEMSQEQLLKYGVTQLADVDNDFHFQGEFAGRGSLGCGCASIGLQVVAQGKGKYIARLIPGGLPGAHWSGGHRPTTWKLTGDLEGDSLILAGDGYSAVVQKTREVVDIRDLSGQLVGTVQRVNRRSPTEGATPPAGAIVLFGGNSTDELVGAKTTADGLLEVGTETKRPVRDFQLHIEFRTPYMPAARGQARGNSGVYIQKRYEVQILDSFGLDSQFNDCGSMYRQKTTDVDMSFPPLAWQTYDIVFRAARFDQAVKIAPATITVRHNGVTVQDNYALTGSTGAGKPETNEALPILIQNHSNPVNFRNIWLVELTPGNTTCQPACTRADHCQPAECCCECPPKPKCGGFLRRLFSR